MKKLISFIFLLFVPFLVNAQDIEITNIELLEKTENVVINNEPTYEGLKINFDLVFNEVDDTAKYKVTVVNNTKEDYEITEQDRYDQDEFIKYEIDKDNNILKAGKTTVITLSIKYDQEVPYDAFEDGVYNKQGTVSFDLSNNEKNPNTSSLPMVAIILSTAFLIAIILLLLNHKKVAIMMIALAIIIIPVYSYAVKKITFDINSKIYIEDRCYTLDSDRGTFESGKDTKEICIFLKDNQYVYNNQSYITSFDNRQSEEDVLVLRVFNRLKENSYVRVYDLEDNLIKEITLKDFPKSLLQLETLYNINNESVIVVLDSYEKDELRVEISEDLVIYDYVYTLVYTSTLAQKTIKGPWISNEDDAYKINTLDITGTSFEENIAISLQGFEQDKNDSHLYHAIWGVTSK